MRAMTQSSSTVSKIKTWAFPALLSIVAWFTVNTLNEIRSDLELVKADVKLLLAQSNIDKTRIDNLERMVYGNMTPAPTSHTPSIPQKPERPYHAEILPVRPEDLYKIVKA